MLSHIDNCVIRTKAHFLKFFYKYYNSKENQATDIIAHLIQSFYYRGVLEELIKHAEENPTICNGFESKIEVIHQLLDSLKMIENRKPDDILSKFMLSIPNNSIQKEKDMEHIQYVVKIFTQEIKCVGFYNGLSKLGL